MVRTADPVAADAKPRRRRTTKRELAQRDLRFVEKLAAGATIEEIAASEGISVKWARERKAVILTSRVIDTPHEFIKLQIRRLSEAMLVSYSAMSNGDLKAVDKVIKVARELDRYHGFAPHLSPSLPAAPPLALPQPQAAESAMDWDESAARDEGAPRDGLPTRD
ncbi:MAG TPA: hypothetical protein VIJ63_02180 [Roseiarcus sp.]